MNNSVKYSFIFGLCFLAFGWVFFVQKTTSELQSAKMESFKLKSDLIELRWGQVMNREMKFGDLENGPEVFNIELSGLDKAILNSDFSSKYKKLSPGLIKAAYLDSGLNSAFFTTKADGETFFVKVNETSEAIMLQGFQYAYILNLLGAGLSDSEWYFLDSKNRVVFSHKASYLGKNKSISAVNSKNLKINNKNYSIQIANATPFSSASALGLGLLGFALLGFASFPSSFGFGGMKAKDTSLNTIASDVIIKKEESFVDDVSPVTNKNKEDLDTFSADEVATTETKVIKSMKEEVFFNKSDEVNSAESLSALDLNTSTLEQGLDGDVGYSEFLTENPSLAMQMPAISNADIVEKNVTKDMAKQPVKELTKEQVKLDVDVIPTDEVVATHYKAGEADSRSGSDWIQLAEELSANLEKFADEWKEEASPSTPDKEA